MSKPQKLKFDKWVDILLLINNDDNCYLQDLARKTETTWTHVSNISLLLLEKGLINREVNQNNMRVKTVTLTKKGHKVQELLKEVRSILKKNGEKTN